MFKFKCLIFLIVSNSLYALTTLHVTSSSDNNPGGFGELGDLRYCLNSMNQELNSGLIEDYAIVFDFVMTIHLNGILPIINNSANPVNITIGNTGSVPTVIIDGNSTYSGFFIPIGNVTIQNITFQNMLTSGGNGGDGISGGGGGMGAGGAIYVPQNFLNGSNPSVTLTNVLINNCSAIGGNGGNCIDPSTFSGNEGGGGGGGFSGNGGSITVTGTTGGGGGGGFGGNGGDVTVNPSDPSGGGGGGGGGIGSRAATGIIDNLGNGGSDQNNGDNGNAYGLTIFAGSGGGGNQGGANAGGGGGGGGSPSGGGGGGSTGTDGFQPQGNTPPGGSATPSGGNGGDGGGGGGGAIVIFGTANSVDGRAGSGGYGGGGGGGSGTGAYDSDIDYTVEGGQGGTGGGGGGGGVDQTGTTASNGGNSLAGGGGGGGGPSIGFNTPGGQDIGNLGGGNGGQGADTVGMGFGGGGGGGGSGLGGAIFIDSGLNLTIQSLTDIPTVFNTANNTTQAGSGGTGSNGATNGSDGSSLGNSIFLRTGSTLTLLAQDTNDILTVGEQVSFTDDTVFGGSGTAVFIRGNGTVIYNGTTDYQGSITINNANFKVNGQIDSASVSVCRNVSFSPQRGTLSGAGTLSGNVFVNSGTIAPNSGETLTLGSLDLNSADPDSGTLGSLVKVEINSSGTNLIAITGAATLAGALEIDLDSSANPGTYVILSSSGITGTFDNIIFTGATPNYTLSYLPLSSPTFVQFTFLGYLEPASNFEGVQKKNNFGFEYELYNQLSWAPSPSTQAIGYFVYRDGIKIATLGASVNTYQDHNRPRNVSTLYSLVAFDENDNTSSPITVTIP